MNYKSNIKNKKSYIGYINDSKRIRYIKVIIYFLIIIGLFSTGLIITKSRLNWFTFVSVLLCLPFAKALVSAIIITPYKSISNEIETKIFNICGVLPLYFEIVLNDEKCFYVIDIMCIMNHNIIIYSPSNKTNEINLEKFIKHILSLNGYNNYTIKVWKDYSSFISRLEEMEKFAQENSYLPTNEHLKLVEYIESISL